MALRTMKRKMKETITIEKIIVSMKVVVSSITSSPLLDECILSV
ncbi:hypothetical protein QWT69_08075 [Sporosarcina oncorhynchi]|uniref:Uncharacterized protein n=1 Tax=Sporosarcina oncorhynchi TaxID=3056444 RepID=A0ABZ0L939_9BACL|nr:hypothetical protein [Sporosarcina sp. T2O-4]WOV89049.1 hypothetical protein QWT69_08075 [Sporosarcina sp. T2O-4]